MSNSHPNNRDFNKGFAHALKELKWLAREHPDSDLELDLSALISAARRWAGEEAENGEYEKPALAEYLIEPTADSTAIRLQLVTRPVEIVTTEQRDAMTRAKLNPAGL